MMQTSILSQIGWPHVALVFGVFFVLIFQKDIRAFISRIKSVGKNGVVTGSAQEVQVERGKERKVEDLLKFGEPQLLIELQEAIKKDLNSRGLETEGDTIKILTRHLALTQIALEFEQIHGIIFGSQIYLLKRLNEVVGQGLVKRFAAEHFTHVQGTFPEQLAQWSLDQYLNFLFVRNLILEKDGNLHITIKGVEFLVWLARTGRTENKNL